MNIRTRAILIFGERLCCFSKMSKNLQLTRSMSCTNFFILFQWWQGNVCVYMFVYVCVYKSNSDIWFFGSGIRIETPKGEENKTLCSWCFLEAVVYCRRSPAWLKKEVWAVLSLFSICSGAWKADGRVDIHAESEDGSWQLLKLWKQAHHTKFVSVC